MYIDQKYVYKMIYEKYRCSMYMFTDVVHMHVHKQDCII